MYSNGSMPSLADIAAVTDNNHSDMWGGNGAWWILIILLAMWGGFGGNGWGNRGQNVPQEAQDVESAVQRGFDTSSIMNKLNGLENGMCSLGYDQLGQMNNISQSIANSTYQIRDAMQQNAIAQMQQAYTNQIAQMQSANALQAQLQSCCCENREAIAGVNYNLATDTCAVTTAIGNAARDITDNANANYRALHDEIVAMRMEDKNDKIAEQAQQINALNNLISNKDQTQYIVDALRTPAPIPSYPVPNPAAFANFNAFNQFTNSCCGQNV